MPWPASAWSANCRPSWTRSKRSWCIPGAASSTPGSSGWHVRAEAGLQSSEEGREGDEDDAPLPLARAVGFADLVSYTSLSRRMNEKTLARLVQRFENKCAEIISVGGGRLVKTVGDEVLYIAETPAAGAEISLALCRAFTEDEILPEARVAMVWGRILSRLGDIYGPTVNLAARLTALADPGTVLVDSMTAAALEADERFVLAPRAGRGRPRLRRDPPGAAPARQRQRTRPGLTSRCRPRSGGGAGGFPLPARRQ